MAIRGLSASHRPRPSSSCRRGLRSRRREVVYEKAALIKAFQPVNWGATAPATAPSPAQPQPAGSAFSLKAVVGYQVCWVRRFLVSGSVWIIKNFDGEGR
jgi:hypothetical protein